MELSGFYRVNVKIEKEVDDGKGGTKTKKSKEIYIVENCGDPQTAAYVVENEMQGCLDTWAIESVKEEKITATLKAHSTEVYSKED